MASVVMEAKKSLLTWNKGLHKNICTTLVFEETFEKLLQKRAIYVPNAKVAAILFTGSIYSLIINWLQDDNSVDLVEYTFPLITYNLQALGIQCNDLDIKVINEEIE